MGCLYAVKAVLQDDAAVRFLSQHLCRHKENGRIRLCLLHHIPIYVSVKISVQPRALYIALGPAFAAGRGNGRLHALFLQINKQFLQPRLYRNPVLPDPLVGIPAFFLKYGIKIQAVSKFI